MLATIVWKLGGSIFLICGVGGILLSVQALKTVKILVASESASPANAFLSLIPAGLMGIIGVAGITISSLLTIAGVALIVT